MVQVCLYEYVCITNRVVLTYIASLAHIRRILRFPSLLALMMVSDPDFQHVALMNWFWLEWRSSAVWFMLSLLKQ